MCTMLEKKITSSEKSKLLLFVNYVHVLWCIQIHIILSFRKCLWHFYLSLSKLSLFCQYHFFLLVFMAEKFQTQISFIWKIQFKPNAVNLFCSKTFNLPFFSFSFKDTFSRIQWQINGELFFFLVFVVVAIFSKKIWLFLITWVIDLIKPISKFWREII